MEDSGYRGDCESAQALTIYRGRIAALLHIRYNGGYERLCT